MLVLLILLLTFSGGVLSGRRPSKHKEPHCPQNEHYVRKNTTCTKTCGNRLLPGETVVDCDPFTGCVCDSGYLRLYDNGTGPCIPRNKCEPIPKKCGKNEVRTSCVTVCPPQSCKSMYSLACDCEPGDCKPGCDCINEYLRNEDGDCVPADDCFLPDGKSSENDNCAQPWYTIFSSSASAESNASASYSDETSSSYSSSTSSSTSSSFSSTSMHTGSGCGTKCKDKNAVYKKCPNPCPLTCTEPKPRPCSKMCLENGCECKPGFILTKIGGICIPPDECPDPLCPKHEHYVMNDPNGVMTCGNRLIPGDSPEVCMSFTGCVCDSGYVRKYDNGTGPCIPKKQCPPIPKNCTKNEEPTSCRIVCPPQTCESVHSSYKCLSTDCEPGCNCINGYLRNSKGICIPSETCPGHSNPCDDPNASPQECASTCQPTCENPDTSDRICTLSCRLGGCVCNPGYILDKPGGTCIRKEDCPKNQNCSDPNASPQYCPSYCQPTCDQPDTSDLICPAACLPSGCVCNPGYILDKEDGTCIKKEDCPGNHQQCTDPNASPSTEECTSPCQPTCDQPDISEIICIKSCQIGTCVCNPGYILDKMDGTCIKIENCPATQKCSDPNASPVDCPSYCQPTCDQPDTSGIVCVDACLPSGCVCNSGYILDKADGTCIKVEDCPGTQECSDPNASPMPCPSYCQPTCGQPDTTDILCIDACLPSGCVCNPGYILEMDGGQCIKVEDCPDNQQCSDPNASPQQCPSYCQPTCDQPDTRGMLCIDVCLPGGCVCNPGYILNTTGGMCIRREDCPGNQQCTDPNASPSTGECTSPCQPTCEQPDTSGIICIMSCQIGACVCNPGYILDKAGGTCVKIEDCPGYEKCKDPNASPQICPSACQPTCDQPDTRDIICVMACLPGGCVCDEGYILDKMEGTCIKSEECPGGSPQCRGNRTYVDCLVDCQDRYCPVDDSTGIVMCNRGFDCYPGCACMDGYLMLSDTERRCILSSECPPFDCTRQNEVWDPSPSNCCQERCEDMDSDCDDSSTGPPRCVCKSGFYRNGSDICVPASECDNQGCDGDRNATSVVCPNPHPPTCAEPNPNSGLSAIQLKYKCMSIGCECKPGFVLSERGGKCIDPIDCPDNQSCNSDSNSTIKECPNACPATCADPDTRNRPCPAICLGLGCECKPGFILSEKNGECIDPEDCPGGEPECGANKTYVYCFAGYPDSYCPTDDSRDMIACDPPYPCPSGCDCEPGYLMLSYENPQCVLSSDCPPVTCTGPNEVWDPSPSNCNLETCDDIDRECDDVSTGPPRCVCKSGFYRNDSDICVPASECDNQGCGGDRNATSVICPDPNPPTCAEPRTNSGPDAIDLETDPIFTCLSIGCECKAGFVLSERGGKCINPIDCPDNQSCNGDSNATIKECPNACPATCADPDTRNRLCPAICLGLGCECKPGFILSEKDGECIDPDDCPGGEPECGANKTYVYCFAGCPYSYCPTDDSRDIIACDPPYPCPSGCGCEPGYLMLSYENPQCVLSSDCPPVTCTRQNEVWDPSPSNLETCDDIDRECDDASTGPARCVCKSGYYRNDSDICVPASECVNQGCGGDRNATSVVCPNPNPPTCAEPGPNDVFGAIDLETDAEFTCLSIGCECKLGFILSERGGQCIDPSDCPDNQSCNGDFNATIKQCPNPCPATCADPDTRNKLCPDICLGIGCDCKNGFILSEDDGECINPKDCPGGGPKCGANKTYVDCFAGCLESYCPIDDSRYVKVCEPPCPCPSGCDCELGYLMLSYENPQCVLSSDCPPVTCTRQNEVWDPSPSNCNLETCDDIDRECDDISTGPPRCVCKSGYYRNDSDICVPASECYNQGCDGDRNATSVICPNPNPPTCAEPGPNGVFGAIDLETDAEFTCLSIGCECKLGFILSERGGQCIDPNDCPENQSCNGDFNATIKQCPNPCPATCADPDTRNRPYPDICLGIGCECKPGFILSEKDGECIDPDDCPGGEPECGINKTYVYCIVGCPYSYCPTDDSLDMIACDTPYPCPSGCDCEPGYLMLSYENPKFGVEIKQ